MTKTKVSRSRRAAAVAHDERLTYREAAARFGVTHQAVHHAYARLYPGEDPPVGLTRADATRRAVAELARVGVDDREIAARVGTSGSNVGRIRRDLGIDATVSARKAGALASAVEAVRSGISAVSAAADHGVSYGHLSDLCRAVGVPLPGTAGRRSGMSVVAADMVDEHGITGADAARLAGCTPSAVYAALRARRDKKK